MTKATAARPGMRSFVGNVGRYAPIEKGGCIQWSRDQVALQADILKLIGRDGALPKKRIIVAMESGIAAIATALATRLDAGEIERYRAMSARRRMDELWCAAGRAPAKRYTSAAGRYDANEIPAAMQRHAALLNAGGTAK